MPHVWRRMGWILALPLLTAGCMRTNSHQDYLPKEQVARAALETALQAWKSGQPMGQFEGPSEAIQVMDAKWRTGQKLESYEILGADPDNGGPTWFSVRLQMKNNRAPVEAKYVVIGKDPLWVYRDEDFKQLSGG